MYPEEWKSKEENAQEAHINTTVLQSPGMSNASLIYKKFKDLQVLSKLSVKKRGLPFFFFLRNQHYGAVMHTVSVPYNN